MSANRPTWNPATGAALAPTMQYSSRDLKSHAKLKTRGDLELIQQQQQQQAFVKNENTLKKELEEETIKNEQHHTLEIDQEQHIDENKDDLSVEQSTSEEEAHDSADNQDSEEDSEEEDDTEALLRELEKIKKEKELEQLRKQNEQKKAKELQFEQARRSNPLLVREEKEEFESFTVKRKWSDDVVFKNQAKGVDEKPKKRFINDTLRSDFHKSFLDRFIN